MTPDEAAATVREALKALPCIGVGVDGLTYGPDYVAAVAALDVLVAAAQERDAAVRLLDEALVTIEAVEARADRFAALLQIALEEWGEGRLAYATQSWVNESRATLADGGGVGLGSGGSSPTPTTGDNSGSAGRQATSGEPPR